MSAIELVGTSEVALARVGGTVRKATIPHQRGDILYGVHGPIAEFYGIDTSRTGELPSPLDHLVAVVGAALIGGLGRSLSHEGVPCDGRLTGTAVGDIAADGEVLFVPRVAVHYVLAVDADVDRAAIDRAFVAHGPACPITRTLGGCVELDLTIETVPASSAPSTD